MGISMNTPESVTTAIALTLFIKFHFCYLIFK